MRLFRKQRFLLEILMLLLELVIMIDVHSACLVQPWENWSFCKGECGNQMQWRIRYFHLDCGNFTAKECVKICNLTHVKGNETRKCINCPEDEWMTYYNKYRQAPPCNSDKEHLSEKVVLYTVIPVLVASLVLCACWYVCTRAKERRKRERKLLKKAEEEIRSPEIPHNRHVRVNSIDVQSQSWNW